MLNFQAMLQAQVKKCVVTEESSDTGLYPIVKVSYMGRANVVTDYFTPYGVYGSPPVGAEGYCLNIGGSEANRLAMVNLMQERFKTDAAGEVIIGNPLTGAKIHFKADGSIHMVAPGGFVLDVTGSAEINASENIDLIATEEINETAPQINLNGNVGANNGEISMVDGVLSTSEDIVADGISLKSHLHSGVQTGGGNSGPPV